MLGVTEVSIIFEVLKDLDVLPVISTVHATVPTLCVTFQRFNAGLIQNFLLTPSLFWSMLSRRIYESCMYDILSKICDRSAKDRKLTKIQLGGLILIVPPYDITTRNIMYDKSELCLIRSISSQFEKLLMHENFQDKQYKSIDKFKYCRCQQKAVNHRICSFNYVRWLNVLLWAFMFFISVD